MKTYTWTELKLEVQREMDLIDEDTNDTEDFVSDNELLQYANAAIDEAEAEIHKLYQDYFKTSTTLSLVSGTSEYSMPSNIYANKIRWLQYDDGSKSYQIKKIRFEDIPLVQTGDDFMYDITFDTIANGYKLVLYPTPATTDSTSVTMWYIRNANFLTTGTDYIDIPECIRFIKAFMKHEIATKEGNPLVQKYETEMEKARQQMKTTLADMTVDEDLDIKQDMSFYEEMN